MAKDLVTIHITNLAPTARSDQWLVEFSDAVSRIPHQVASGADLPLEIFDRRGAKIGTIEWSSEAFLMRKAG
jgi:hypothetical protein